MAVSAAMGLPFMLLLRIAFVVDYRGMTIMPSAGLHIFEKMYAFLLQCVVVQSNVEGRYQLRLHRLTR